MSNTVDTAILGPSGSGKSDLAIELAQKCNGIILSLDSLSIYKEIDIASAKPSKEELATIKHFGVDEIFINEDFNVVKFFDYYKEAKEYANTHKKRLFIVGGSSFYLKMLIDGISKVPKLDKKNEDKLFETLKDLKSAYYFLEKNDPIYAQKISNNDRYRIEKALTIIYGSQKTLTQWFAENQTEPIIKDIKIFSIDTPKDTLLKRVSKRTEKMFEMGIIDEAAFLEQKYSLEHKPLFSIGLKECYNYLNGEISLQKCQELITIHTMQLAKRQKTFNKGQFKDVIFNTLDELRIDIKRHIIC